LQVVGQRALARLIRFRPSANIPGRSGRMAQHCLAPWLLGVCRNCLRAATIGRSTGIRTRWNRHSGNLRWLQRWYLPC